jgi:ribose 5-phosphate isomerase B
MKVYLGTDHRGFELKEKLKAFLIENGYDVEDFGAFAFEDFDDYPDYIKPAAEAVSKNPTEDRAIVLGATGQGEAIAANRFKGVRAIVYYGGPEEIITLSREHNDANVLSIGASFIQDPQIFDSVRIWLETPFSNDERHLRRIKKIDETK